MTIKQIHRSFNHVVAFEVSKETLVVHVLPGDRRLSIPNKLQAVRRVLRSEIKHNAKSELGPLLIVVESTGGYERHVLQAGIELELSVHKAHGSRVRFFAKYLGLAAKTDPIDARVLALFGLQTAGLILYAPPSINERALRGLKARRDEIQAICLPMTHAALSYTSGVWASTWYTPNSRPRPSIRLSPSAARIMPKSP